MAEAPRSPLTPKREYPLAKSPPGGPRWQVYVGSQSSHCCFEATVVDTHEPHDYRDSDDGQYHYEPICECFSVEEAQQICDALNAQEGRS